MAVSHVENKQLIPTSLIHFTTLRKCVCGQLVFYSGRGFWHGITSIISHVFSLINTLMKQKCHETLKMKVSQTRMEFAVRRDGRAVMSARLEKANPHGGKSCPRPQSCHQHLLLHLQFNQQAWTTTVLLKYSVWDNVYPFARPQHVRRLPA